MSQVISRIRSATHSTCWCGPTFTKKCSSWTKAASGYMAIGRFRGSAHQWGARTWGLRVTSSRRWCRGPCSGWPRGRRTPGCRRRSRSCGRPDSGKDAVMKRLQRDSNPWPAGITFCCLKNTLGATKIVLCYVSRPKIKSVVYVTKDLRP